MECSIPNYASYSYLINLAFDFTLLVTYSSFIGDWFDEYFKFAYYDFTCTMACDPLAYDYLIITYSTFSPFGYLTKIIINLGDLQVSLA